MTGDTTGDGTGERPAGLGRRSLLATGIGALGAAAGAGGYALTRPDRDPQATATGTPGDAGRTAATQVVAVGRARVAPEGPHQAGILTPEQAFASFVAFDLEPGTDRDGLRRLMKIWTDDVRRLASGAAALADTEPELAVVPARLTVTVGWGPRFFDAAGLAAQRPSWLAPLPPFSIDRLRPEWTGGDLVVQVCADDQVTVAHAVRVLAKDARTLARVRWLQRGFRRSVGSQPPGTTMRNLMGQVDGSRNLKAGVHDDLIWNAGEPPWLAGGTSMVVRRIAIDLETWERVDRTGREASVGRRLSDGAPLTGTAELDEPDLEAVNSLGLPVISDVAHIRRARTTDPTQRFFRRGYNYDEPPPPGQLSDSGLIFVSFQADVAKQFVPIQRQLAEVDLLNEWTTPIGSAVFAVPPGFGPDQYLGQQLLGGAGS